MTKSQIEEAKKKAIAFYESGNPDAALETIQTIPREERDRDKEIGSLLFAMRCDDQAKGIVSTPNP